MPKNIYSPSIILLIIFMLFPILQLVLIEIAEFIDATNQEVRSFFFSFFFFSILVFIIIFIVSPK